MLNAKQKSESKACSPSFHLPWENFMVGSSFIQQRMIRNIAPMPFLYGKEKKCFWAKQITLKVALQFKLAFQNDESEKKKI